MTENTAQLENWHNFKIGAPREIIAILRSIGEKNQLVRMLISGEADVAVTSILHIDPDAGVVYVDVPIDPSQGKRALAVRGLMFETTLDKIRIMFEAPGITETTYKGGNAYKFKIPESVVRLQRREYYRMETPVTNPVRVTITLPEELGGDMHAFPLSDISCGGVAILDPKLILDVTVSKNYENCRIDLPDVGLVTTTLQVRSSHEITLLNAKQNRRVGCEFINISRGNLAGVQRYITKLERERNARVAGLT
jgi:c-di-GMP-binding flagellar brake protein YcgR